MAASCGVLAALASAWWMWGYTVDDALISVRYARNLADGHGYRFNAVGPSTDGVTPLPWPFLLAPFARADALTVLLRAKCIGASCWMLAAAAWSWRVADARAPWWAKGIAIAGLALALPIAANAVSGMETALAMSLATFAAVLPPRQVKTIATLAGLTASLRPEMAAWAIVLAVGVAFAGEAARASAKPDPHGVSAVSGRAVGRIATGLALAIAPFAICAAARVVFFGHAAPLSLTAKPSDLAHGMTYALGAFLGSLAPVLAFAPFALARARGVALVLALAGAAHFGALVLVGGDWMAYWRLAAPIAPSLLYAFVLASSRVSRAHIVATFLRGAIAVGAGASVVFAGGTAGRRVGEDRRVLVESARGPLAGARRVAALDIGWVSAASDAEIIDLAGLTDPTIAALAGGHTSKRIDAATLLARDPDVLLIYSNERQVEARLEADELIETSFERIAFLPLGTAGYSVLWRARSP